ncbi:MAG: TIGR04283 family arsenosugar biosynthesis glycosyltransferase [Cyanobacteria bacterium Co-bin8]|nr:TIGR04283 family arsenosugar biosynthesis glycosyltransferase [Cyanobacteria bacterium Co-bin8]
MASLTSDFEAACKVSIIIPALNEAAYLERTVRHLSLLQPPAHEVIVVDGGSRDETVAIAQALTDQLAPYFPLQVISSDQAGRAIQMNLGAAQASGDYLCFLHADTYVPDDLVSVIAQTLADPGVSCGGFISIMSGNLTTRWGVILNNYLKTYYAPLLFRPHLFFGKGLRLLFGDQVMFCRRADFQTCNGFDPAQPILEEADLCLKLCRLGRIRQVNRVVQASDRRVAGWGPVKANAIYFMVGFLWGLGVPGERLKRFYEDVR